MSVATEQNVAKVKCLMKKIHILQKIMIKDSFSFTGKLESDPLSSPECMETLLPQGASPADREAEEGKDRTVPSHALKS